MFGYENLSTVPNMNKELNLVVMPSGVILLEWSDTKEPIEDKTRLLQEQVHKRYLSGQEDWLLYLGFSDTNARLSDSLEFMRSFASEFVRKLTRTPDLETLRHELEIPFDSELFHHYLQIAPMMTGVENLRQKVLESLWRRLNKEFSSSIKKFNGTVQEFVNSYSPDIHPVGRVFFHMVENKKEGPPFAFLATYSTGIGKGGKSKHLPVKYALQEYEDDSHKLLELLSTVNRAAQKSELIKEILNSGEIFHPLGMSTQDAFAFLREVPIYEEAGILCRIPNWWKGKASGASLKISIGDSSPSYVGMNSLLEFNARLFVGDEEISEEEARSLLEESEGLAFIKGRWVAADPEKLQRVLEAYDKAKSLMNKNGLSMQDALRFQLNPEKFLVTESDKVNLTISNGKWLESVMEKLVDPDRIAPVEPDQFFKAELRKYQKKGLNWLWFLHSLQFGACLADDMGLGKTVEILGFLSVLKNNGKSGSYAKASLIIIPASLIANWEQEILRFAPDLIYYIAHPEAHRSKSVEKKDEKALNSLDLVITTYTLVQKYAWLQSYSWNYVILDEAQAIKNPSTKQARAIKKLTARNRIIMTGTPIENRLSDLWSLFDFLNPGLLGTAREFKSFSKNIKNDPTGYSRLRKVISPYILRRLKTDKNVISDLPDKVEMKTYTHLSRKQVAFYEQLVRELEDDIEQTAGIQRKGLILASLMKFKQICNHPDQYLGTGGFKEKYSGKFSRLREVVETIYEKREKVLVFTQFKEITAPLSEFLAEIFGREGLVLHGSVPVGKRKILIEQFQGQAYVPFMVLSLKAGGVGLNLTAANHVIHFDRWWNPAVENQATDRAFRIGQKKNVLVHKFITRGTIEEKIDLMLEQKAELSNEIIASSGEKWITELNTRELMNLFKLSL
jgi:SNF2 family DNA or RNA helicase